MEHTGMQFFPCINTWFIDLYHDENHNQGDRSLALPFMAGFSWPSIYGIFMAMQTRYCPNKKPCMNAWFFDLHNDEYYN